MSNRPHRPLIVWFTITFLAISSAFFLISLVGLLFVYGEARALHIQPALLLVAMPLGGLIGLKGRKFWGRELSLLSLASLWAFILQGFLSIFGEKPIPDFRMTPLLVGTFLLLVSLLLLLPTLFVKLRWGLASREFFDN